MDWGGGLEGGEETPCEAFSEFDKHCDALKNSGGIQVMDDPRCDCRNFDTF